MLPFPAFTPFLTAPPVRRPNLCCQGTSQAAFQTPGQATGDRFIRFGKRDPLPTLDYFEITRLRSRWKAPIRRQLQAVDRQLAGHPAVRKARERFQLTDESQGILPALLLMDPVHADMRLGSTHGALAVAALEVVKRLPPASSAFDAFAQMDETLEQLNAIAQKRTKALGKPPVGEPSPGIGIGWTPMEGLETKVYSSIQNGHLMFIGTNGAIQIVRVPTPWELIEMIRKDSMARLGIHAYRPINLKVRGMAAGARSQDGLDLKKTVAHLWDLSEGHFKDRQIHGWTDVHTLLKCVPFDYAEHIKAGRLQVLMDKPGRDGKTCWESVLTAVDGGRRLA